MNKSNYNTLILFLITTVFHIVFTILFTNIVIHSIQNDMMTKQITEINDNLKLSRTNITNDKDEFIPVITIDRSEDDTVEIPIEYRYDITEKEFQEFVRVVEAEVTGDNPFGVGYEAAFEAKLHVAQVILNRVESPYFPNTVHDVIFQKNAFTPLVDGRYWEVDISQVTIDACKYALLASTEDTTQGCEFFMSRSKECKYGSYVFTDKVGHSFFSYYRNNE